MRDKSREWDKDQDREQNKEWDKDTAAVIKKKFQTEALNEEDFYEAFQMTLLSDT